MGWDEATDSILGATTRAFARRAAVLYTPAGGGPQVDLTGRSIFTAAHAEEALEENEVVVNTVKATLDVKLRDIPVAPTEGDPISVGGVQYTLGTMEPDGEGGALLILDEVP